MKKKDDKKSNEQPNTNDNNSTNNKNLTDNWQDIILLREAEISNLKQEKDKKIVQIVSFESELSELRLACVNTFKNEKEIKQLKETVVNLEKEIRKYQDDMVDVRLKCDEKLRIQKDKHELEIHRIGATIENYQQKVEMVNQLILDKELMKEQLNNLKEENEKVKKENCQALQTKEIANQNKFSRLKNKMMSNINKTQSKVTELNVQFMDVSSKLTVLQNQQLLIQLEYKTREIDELNKKKEELEKKVFELSKDIEIHKEVEISLAEKNKKLNQYNKRKNNSEGISIGISDHVHNTSMHIKKSINQTVNSEVTQNNAGDYSNIINLEKKIFRLEKRLTNKSNEYQKLKDQYEFIELKINNYESKYCGLFNFLEEALITFIEDEDLKKNTEIYVNIDLLKQSNFTQLSKEEKYSVLVILMKYLLPLANVMNLSINNTKSNCNIGSLNNNFKSKPLNKMIEESQFKTGFTVNSGKKKIKKNSSFDSLPLLRYLKK